MRRLRADLMLCFKMLKGFVDVDASEFFERVAPDCHSWPSLQASSSQCSY